MVKSNIIISIVDYSDVKLIFKISLTCKQIEEQVVDHINKITKKYISLIQQTQTLSNYLSFHNKLKSPFLKYQSIYFVNEQIKLQKPDLISLNSPWLHEFKFEFKNHSISTQQCSKMMEHVAHIHANQGGLKQTQMAHMQEASLDFLSPILQNPRIYKLLHMDFVQGRFHYRFLSDQESVRKTQFIGHLSRDEFIRQYQQGVNSTLLFKNYIEGCVLLDKPFFWILLEFFYKLKIEDYLFILYHLEIKCNQKTNELRWEQMSTNFWQGEGRDLLNHTDNQIQTQIQQIFINPDLSIQNEQFISDNQAKGIPFTFHNLTKLFSKHQELRNELIQDFLLNNIDVNGWDNLFTVSISQDDKCRINN